MDLNCGCPQRWALNDGYGAQLLKNPEIIKDCVRQFRNRIPTNKTISVKLRLLDDHRQVTIFKKINAYEAQTHSIVKMLFLNVLIYNYTH